MRSLNLVVRAMKILACNFWNPVIVFYALPTSVTNMNGTLQIKKMDTIVKENETKMMTMYILSFLGNSFDDYSNQESYFHPFFL